MLHGTGDLEIRSEKESGEALGSGIMAGWRTEGEGSGWGVREAICPELEVEGTLRELVCTAGEGHPLSILVHWTDVCGGKTGMAEMDWQYKLNREI